MKREVYVGGILLLGTMFLAAGCTTTGKHNRDIAGLQSQIGVLQNEMARLDQALKESESLLRGRQAQAPGLGVSSGLAAKEGPVYRTASGFELPATAIQRALKNAGYYQGSIDGKIGSDTKEALRSFQRDNGLKVDGVCGRQTWTQLKAFA